jgi:peroxiredoxin Q/BCP
MCNPQVSKSALRLRRLSYLGACALALFGCKRTDVESKPKAEPSVYVAPARPAPELLAVGQELPDVSATTQTGETLRLRELKGKPLVVYFYPKDDTAGCTAEAREISALTPQLTELGAVVVGVSSDDEGSHREFANKYSLPFRLLVDTDHRLAEAFHVPLLANGRASRVTFVFGRDGRLARSFPNVNPRGHGQELLTALKALPGT